MKIRKLLPSNMSNRWGMISRGVYRGGKAK